MHHLMRGLLTTKKLFSSASAERRKKEQENYLQNGSAVLEEILALCDGNCRIPIRYFTAIEIERATKHSKSKMDLSDVSMVTGYLDNRPVLVRFDKGRFRMTIHRDIAITAQMSHLKNVLRLIGCCLEFEDPVMVYEYVEGKSLSNLLFKSSHDQTGKSLSWGNRLRVAREVASAVVFLHTEFKTPIIHRDIKPHKVIIEQHSGVAKIVDFSMSISLPPGELEVQDILCGTRGYFDPEFLRHSLYTQKTDVYSFGVLLLELLTGKKVCDIMESDIEEGNIMDRVNSAIPEEPIDFEEDAESNIEEGNSMDRVDSAIPEEPIDFEEGAESNIEEGNSMDRVDSAIPEDTIDFENFLPNLIDHYIKEGNLMDIADHAILEEHGIEIQQQLEDYLVLVKKCTTYNGENRPYMIHVARELRRIENCFRALSLGQN